MISLVENKGQTGQAFASTICACKYILILVTTSHFHSTSTCMFSFKNAWYFKRFISGYL